MRLALQGIIACIDDEQGQVDGAQDAKEQDASGYQMQTRHEVLAAGWHGTPVCSAKCSTSNLCHPSSNSYYTLTAINARLATAFCFTLSNVSIDRVELTCSAHMTASQ